MIGGMSYYQILWYFLFYSLIGWIIEVIYHAVSHGKIINRGFLNGPLCPVYGFGMITVLAASNIAQDAGIITLQTGAPDGRSTALLFLGGMLLATSIELVAGWLLDVFFHMRWWDYSRQPFNLHGYICLEFSIIWGIAITLAVYLVHPLMVLNSEGGLSIPETYGWPMLVFFYVVFFFDLTVTVATVIGLNKRLAELDRISESMRILSDRMSETIGASTIKTSQKIGEGQVQAALAKAELKDAVAEKKHLMREKMASEKEELRTRYAQLEKRAEKLRREAAAHPVFGAGRILHSLPRHKFPGYRKALSELLDRLDP